MKKGKRAVNKSAVVREIHSADPKLKAADILKVLQDRGIPATLQTVYQALKSTSKKSKKRGRPAKAAVAAPKAAKAPARVDLLAATQEFVKAAGGIDQAIAILSVFK